MTDWDLISVDAAEPVLGAQIGKVVLRTHGPQQCQGQACCIHNPSGHHMRSWPQNWRADRGLMERICRHGVGHPDPDHMSYVLTINPATADGVHGCDGCCRGGL